jgi:hypothetical protein
MTLDSAGFSTGRKVGSPIARRRTNTTPFDVSSLYCPTLAPEPMPSGGTLFSRILNGKAMSQIAAMF